MRLTDVGERYASACQRVLTELKEADLSVAGERTAPRGLLTITAPVMFGTCILRPIVGAFLRAHPAAVFCFSTVWSILSTRVWTSLYGSRRCPIPL